MDIYATMRGLVSRYRFLRCSEYGRSAAGRPLRCLTLGSGPRTGIMTAAHHANEWITAPALLGALDTLCAEYAAGGLRGARMCFVPLVNPDGAALVTGELHREALLRRARAIAGAYPDVPFPEGWKANIRGTDLNLQYPAGWDAAREIKFAQGWVSPAPRDYVGRAPLSEPESRALFGLTRRLAPAAAAALHTQGEVIYWQYHGYAPPGAEELARRLAAASGYALDTVPDESSNAGYKDWCIDSLDIPAYTVECGLGENPLPTEQLGAITDAVLAICRELFAWLAA